MSPVTAQAATGPMRVRQAVQIVTESTRSNGYPPSLADIAARMGLRSKSTVLTYLHEAVALGLLESYGLTHRAGKAAVVGWRLPHLPGDCPTCGRAWPAEPTNAELEFAEWNQAQKERELAAMPGKPLWQEEREAMG